MIVSREHLGQLKGLDYQSGCAILIDKPLDWTSFNVVSKLRYALCQHYGVKRIKVGHAGTLDPLASGLLIICTGKMTKRITEFMGQEKGYEAELTMGAITPSYDLETEPQDILPFEHIDEDQIEKVLEGFKGDIMQTPPQFSAKQVKGKRAYEHARKGVEVKLDPCPVHISELVLETFTPPTLKLSVACSKGTYIRSLAHDIGQSLGTGAHLSGLIRSRIGEYNIKDALSIDEFVSEIS